MTREEAAGHLQAAYRGHAARTQVLAQEKAKAGGATRVYSDLDRVKHEGKALMYTATDEPPSDHDAKQFEAPTSMRDVEPSVHVWLRFAQLEWLREREGWLREEVRRMTALVARSRRAYRDE